MVFVQSDFDHFNLENFTKGLTKKRWKEAIDVLDYQYHTVGKPWLKSSQYDAFREAYEAKYQTSLPDVGGEIPDVFENGEHRKKVVLPFRLTGIEKVKPDKPRLKSWLTKYPGPKLGSDKLDGMAALFDLKTRAMYTRGSKSDGKGQDISVIVPHISGIPDTFDQEGFVRGELIVSKKNWLKIQKKTEYTASRNFVVGFCTSKTFDRPELFKYVDFVAYERIVDTTEYLPIQEQNKMLADLGFNVPENRMIENPTQNGLIDLLSERMQSSCYEIDGIVLYDLEGCERDPTKSHPDHIKAFKIDEDDVSSTVITDVSWVVQKDGKIQPKIKYKPFDHETGATLTSVTGNSARWFVNMGLFVGANIQVIRSGGIIPKIIRVLNPDYKRAKKLENVVKKFGPDDIGWFWNGAHIFVSSTGEESKEAKKERKRARLLYALNVLGIEHFSKSTVEKAVDLGFDTIQKVLRMSVKDLQKLEGVKDKTSAKIWNSIQFNYENATVERLVAASNKASGFAIKKLHKIFDAIPDLLERGCQTKEEKQNLVEEILKIDGFALKTAQDFVSKLLKIQIFFSKLPPRDAPFKPIKNDVVCDTRLAGKSYVFTGVRNTKLEQRIRELGGLVKTGVSKTTTHLVVPDGANDKILSSSKAVKAKIFGVTFVTISELKKEL